MIIKQEQEEVKYIPVTVTFETLEEFKHFIACISISDADRMASARTCGFDLGEGYRNLSTKIWNATEEIRKCIPGCS